MPDASQPVAVVGHINGSYVWLPMKFEKDRFTISWHDDWDFSVIDRISEMP